MTPYLPTLTKLGILEGEAGNRAQSDSRYGLTLALTGGSYDETDSRKATQYLAERNKKTLTTPEISIPPLNTLSIAA